MQEDVTSYQDEKNTIQDLRLSQPLKKANFLCVTEIPAHAKGNSIAGLNCSPFILSWLVTNTNIPFKV